MADVESKYEEFLSFCSKLLKGESMQFLSLLKKRYGDCSASFRSSPQMADLLEVTRGKLLTDPKRMFVHLKEFTTELKAWGTQARPNPERRKRKADGPLGAVSKMGRSEDSLSEGSDAEGKLCRAMGGGTEKVGTSASSSGRPGTGGAVPVAAPCAEKPAMNGSASLASGCVRVVNGVASGSSVGKATVVDKRQVNNGTREQESKVDTIDLTDSTSESQCELSLHENKQVSISQLPKTKHLHSQRPYTDDLLIKRVPLLHTCSEKSSSQSHSSGPQHSQAAPSNRSHSKQPASTVPGLKLNSAASPSGNSEWPKNCTASLPGKSELKSDCGWDTGSMEAASAADLPSCSGDVEMGSELDAKTKRQVQKLEKLLKKLHEEIDKMRDKELSLDELDDEVSPYIYEDRLQKKFVKVWNRLCQLQGRDTSSGRPLERRFKYEGTRYPEINRKIQKFVNRPDCFPDYHDIRNIVRKVNTRCKLGLNVMQVNSVSREAFLDVGDTLQKRRHEDFIATFRSRHTTAPSKGQDPAMYDEELRRKLEENGRVGKSRMEEVLSKYSDLQMELVVDSDLQKSAAEEEADGAGEGRHNFVWQVPPEPQQQKEEEGEEEEENDDGQVEEEENNDDDDSQVDEEVNNDDEDYQVEENDDDDSQVDEENDVHNWQAEEENVDDVDDRQQEEEEEDDNDNQEEDDSSCLIESQ